MFTKEIAEDADCWIKFQAFGGQNSNGVFNMVKVPSAPTHTAAVFYDQNDKILAAVLVEYNPTSTPGDEEVMFKITTGAGEIVKMDQNSDMYMAISGNFNVTDVYQITTNDKMIYVETPVEYWNVMAAETTAPFANYSGPITFEGASPNFYIYTNGCTARSEVIYVLQVVGPDGVSMVNHSAVHVIFDPDAAIEEKAPFSFVYPEYVQGATLQKYTGDMQAMQNEFYGVSADTVYELRYTVAQPMMAMITVPSMPAFGAAWNNYDALPDYWLTYEAMDDKSILVNMNPDKAKKGETDYLVFKAADGTFSAVLVCVYDPAE